ncbi:MAG: hypothetical protein U1F08_05205 [Steroidobacteraceae bacterium]
MSDEKMLVESLRRWTLVLGVLQVLAGCLVGLTPPESVAWFRGIVMAHIEFTANGALVIVLGLLVREFALGPAALKAWFVLLQFGSWMNGASGVVAAVSGQSSPLMPTINARFPPPVAGDNALVSGLLGVCGLAILAALLLTLVGLWRAGRQVRR